MSAIPQEGDTFTESCSGRKFRIDKILDQDAVIFSFDDGKMYRMAWPPTNVEAEIKQVAAYNNDLFHVPRNMINALLEVAFDYKIGELPDYEQPIILDIGANCGAFSIGALQRWKEGNVRAYEPNPVMLKLLRENMKGLPVQIFPVALAHPVTPEHPKFLMGGIGNSGCCSLYDVGEQDPTTGVEVELLDSATLPPADIIKIDTEGSDVEIMEGYQHWKTVKSLLVEYHRSEDALKIRAIAEGNGLTLLNMVRNTLRFSR